MNNAKKKVEEFPVIVIISLMVPEDGNEAVHINVLHSYGGTRVFTYPSGVDPRVGNPPLKLNWEEVGEHFKTESSAVLLPFKEAKTHLHGPWADFTLGGLK